MATLEWSPIEQADLRGLVHLAEACLHADGGYPPLATDEYIQALFMSDVGIAGRDDTTDIVAAAALGTNGERRTATGLVHPSMRRQGHGEMLVEWCRKEAGTDDLLVIAETMSLEAESLFAASGLHRVFAESVMRHKLRTLPRVRRPDGIHRREFSPETELDFYTAFVGSFGDRPAYRAVSAQEWLADVRSTPGFRPELSRVALTDDDEPVGFVLVSDDWIDEVGVVPAWRGKALGAHLVARSLTALRKAGSERVWLCVNVDNPSRGLYERLGFRIKGTRARYENRETIVKQITADPAEPASAEPASARESLHEGDRHHEREDRDAHELLGASESRPREIDEPREERGDRSGEEVAHLGDEHPGRHERQDPEEGRHPREAVEALDEGGGRVFDLGPEGQAHGAQG